MKYLEKTFTVGALDSDAYRSNWERTFRKKPTRAEVDDHGVCDDCLAHDVDLYCRGGRFFCAECVGIVLEERP